ncbi:MAG: DegV family protein [Caldilineales bacterium]|nr:DegV family protein [Caldilineales bacterium]
MTRIAIVADSGCDLPPALIERYQIDIVPLIARFGDEELIDGAASRATFWQRYDISQPPQTSGPSPGMWAEGYERALQNCDEVVAMTVTGKHSGTFNSAVLAAADFGGRVQVFDTWSLSLGEGLLVLRAAQLAEAQNSSQEILADLESARRRLHIYILLDTIEAVQRGGRLAPVMSVIKRMSGVLSIKPILTLNEGEIRFSGAVRSMRRGMQQLLNQETGITLDTLAVAHTRNQDMADLLVAQLALSRGIEPTDILQAEAGPALAVHAGPGALGAAFLRTQSTD